jgi:hypothetical protein
VYIFLSDVCICFHNYQALCDKNIFLGFRPSLSVDVSYIHTSRIMYISSICKHFLLLLSWFFFLLWEENNFFFLSSTNKYYAEQTFSCVTISIWFAFSSSIPNKNSFFFFWLRLFCLQGLDSMQLNFNWLELVRLTGKGLIECRRSYLQLKVFVVRMEWICILLEDIEGIPLSWASVFVYNNNLNWNFVKFVN